MDVGLIRIPSAWFAFRLSALTGLTEDEERALFVSERTLRGDDEFLALGLGEAGFTS